MRDEPFQIADEPQAQPFLYEIRVRGKLSNERWTAWFDDLTLSIHGDESVLRGVLRDHAALYGLLGRLRDLAVPLLSVRVLDARAQHKLYRQSRRYDLFMTLMLATIYLTLVGGLATITVFVAPIIHVGLALALLFALLGGLAHGFWAWSGQPAWRWLGYGLWPIAALTFLIYVAVTDLLPTALAIAMILFFLSGGLLYLLYALRRRTDGIKSALIDWEALRARRRAGGEQTDEVSGEERA
ncbi:MAG: hypothetical protein JXA74_05080 [Anaerolineae bacterium]|nr:hypothetical protein [Anaerolineae bacterium]